MKKREIKKIIMGWCDAIDYQFKMIVEQPELIGEELSFRLVVGNLSDYEIRSIIKKMNYTTSYLCEEIAGEEVFLKTITVNRGKGLQYVDGYLVLKVSFHFEYYKYDSEYRAKKITKEEYAAAIENLLNS